MDAKLDPLLEEMGHDELKGKVGIANATQIYQQFNRNFTRKRWQKLATNGGRAQRVLWGSTSTKDPAYPDTLYVDNLIGAKTVNTVPPDTLEAFMDHGTVAHTIDQNLPEAQKHFEALKDAGFDITEIGDELQAEGVDKFVRSYDNLIQAIEKERDAVAEAH
jgi:transaldolase